MIRNLLLSTIAAAFCLSMFWVIAPSEVSPDYQERTAVNPTVKSGAAFSADYFRRNANTGKVEPSDRLMVRSQISQRANRAGSLGLEWASLGPDNVGGRTRGMVELIGYPDTLYAGSVSGGLFYSYDGGAHWQPHSQFQNLDSSSSIISGVYQDPISKKVYVSTGSSFDAGGTGLKGYVSWPGFGLYVSDDLGVTFRHIKSTTPDNRFTPSSPSGGQSEWIATNRLAFGPNGEIYAATNKGLRVSKDDGATWTNPIVQFINNDGEPIFLTQVCDDVVATRSGKIIAALGNKVYIAESVDEEFEQASSTGLPTVAGRIVLAVSPQDDDYIYAMYITPRNPQGGSNGEQLNGVYKTTNGGDSWNKIVSRYQGFTPMCYPVQCQGIYDAALAVDPNDKDVFILGGIELWRYDGNLTRIAVEYPSSADDFNYYVHADKHYIYFSPNVKNRVYVCSDGGVTRSDDRGNTWLWSGLNKGYVTTQFYSVDHATQHGIVIGGTQDNGTQVVLSDNEFDPLAAQEVLGGDGFDVAVSQLSSFYFATIYYGTLVRGEYGTTAQTVIAEGGNDGPFWTIIDLWESIDEESSKDFFYFTAEPTEIAIGTSNGVTRNYKETVSPVQPAAKVVPTSIVVEAGNQVLTNAADPGVLTGSGTGTVEFNDDGTFIVDVTFNAAPSENSNVFVTFDVEYEANSVLYVSSKNLRGVASEHVFEYRLESDLFPGDSVKIQDPVQTLVAKSTAQGLSIYRGLYSTFNPANQIPISAITGQVTAAKFTEDGTTLFVGTQGGQLYRVSDLKNLYSLEDYDPANVKSHTFGTGAPISGLATDPNDPNRLIVTIGRYGLTENIFYTENALDPTMSFTNVHGDLPPFPIYDAAIDMHEPNRVLIGTEFGVWATEDITSSSVAWSDENGPDTYLPVYAIRQQHLPFEQAFNTGVYYIGTYGRGFWETASLVGVPEFDTDLDFEGHVSDMKIFPNPLSVEGNIEFKSKQAGTAKFMVYDLNGRMVNSFSSRVNAGNNRIKMNSSNLRNGSYFLTMEVNGEQKVNKFMVLK